MSEPQPVLQKPPGYRDPTLPLQKPPVYRKPNFLAKKHKSCCRTFCCCFCLLIIMATLFFIVVGGFFYIWFKPQLPTLHLKSFHIPKFNITSTQDGLSLATQTVFGVEFKNPNSELSIIYDGTHVYVNGPYGLDLGTASLGGFTQWKKNVSVLKVTTKLKQLVGDDVGRKVKDGFERRSLEVSVEVRTGVGLGLGKKGWKTKTVSMKAVCGGFTLKQMESGDMPTCGIKLLQW